MAQPVVFGLAYLAFAMAVAIRFGAIPFHIWAARLTDTVPEAALPIVTAWGPAAFAVVALAWTDQSIAPLLVEMDAERGIVLAVAVATIVLAAFAAWIQDDLEHVVGYSIIGDAGVVLLAIAALDPDAWAPARTWILAYVVTRSAFAAWAASLRATYGTGRIPNLRGWAVRSPVLAIALGLIVLAGIGLPGLAAFDARASLVHLAVPDPFAALVLLATFAPLAYEARLFAVGLRRPPAEVPAPVGRGGLPRRTPLDVNDVRGSAGTFWTRQPGRGRVPADRGARGRRARGRGGRPGRSGGGGRGRTGGGGTVGVVRAGARARDVVRDPVPGAGRGVPRRFVPADPDELTGGYSPGASTQRSTSRSYSNSSPGSNQRASSAVAASGPSDAWTMFWAVSSA